MALKVPRKLSGRTIRKDQLDDLLEEVRREFGPSPEDDFSIAVGESVYDGKSFEEVLAQVGRITFVDNLTIKIVRGTKSFTFSAQNGLIEIDAAGGEQYFSVGFGHRIKDILTRDASRLHRILPTHTRRIIDWFLLPLESVLAVVAVLMTALMVGWVAAVTAASLSVALLLITLVVRRRFATYILLQRDAREPWLRAHRLGLVSIVIAVLMPLIVNAPTWFEEDAAPVTPKSGSTGQSSSSAEATASRSAASALSRDTQRSPLTKVKVEPAVGPAGEPFILTGKGFEPGTDVLVELVAGPGTTLSEDKAERRLVRVNDKGEIGPEKITAGRGVCCSRGVIRVVATPDGQTAGVETAYKLE
ncbi:hypothetical protein ABZ896_16980 [Streptomyces sp. NPDC047072]|uniref:DUF3488 domain-containing protein n=1 Tax=Streptomyces sp. NPDC047072 TaxID=3154809 RepID=UPI0033CC8920